MDDLAPDRRGAPEELRRRLDIARTEKFADPRRRHSPAGFDGPHIVHDVDVEPQFGAELGERLGVARTASAEAEVVSDEHRADAERADEHVLHELSRRQVRELLVEAEHERRIDARLAEELELLMHADEVLGADLGPQQRERIAVERDGDDSGAAGGGIHPRPVEHRAMAGVHAVELADRDDRGAETRRHLRRVAEDDHGVTTADAASVAVDGSRADA